jgi:hypothetical protein
MKRIVRELLVLASLMSAGTLVVGARQAPAPPAAPAAATNAPGPKIQFATALYDFGRVRAGDPVKYTYVFTNTGDALLVLNSVQPQCGCTTAGEWTKQVEPGKTGVIPIQFNTAAYNGGVFKQVTVSCNVTNQPMLFVQLKGTVFRPYDVNPQMAVFNVAPDADGAASMVITITNNMEEPLLLSAPTINNPIFSAELVTNQPGKGYQVKVSTVPPLPATGSAQGQMVLKTSWTNTPPISVTLMANVQPAVMVTPPFINLPPGPLPRAMTNSVMIQNNSVANVLKLSEPKVSVEGVGIEIKETQPGRVFSVLLAFPQGFEAPAGQQTELSLKTSNPKFPEVKVPVRQMPRPVAPMQSAPVMAPTPNFPLVPPGTPPPAPAGKVSSAGDPPPPPRPPLPPGL